MFWRKGAKEQRLHTPTGIPDLVGRHLVTDMKKDPDWAWKLKGVVRQRGEGKDTFDVRIFDEAEKVAKKVTVVDYTSLDEHLELILYEGWFDKKSMQVKIEEKRTV